MILRFIISFIIVLIFHSTTSSAQEGQYSVKSSNDDLEYIDQYLKQSQESKENNYCSGISFRGLNKITAHITKFHSKVGQAVAFGNLEIIPKICWKSNADEPLENKALFEIFETKTSGHKEKIFYGWMFSSSPSISSLEHALYDITLLECYN